MAGIKVKIPKVSENEVVTIPKGEFGDLKEKTERRFEKIDNLLFAIIGSVVISGIAVVIAVIGIFLDQLRYNNAAYHDYSQKNEVLVNLQKTNASLLNEVRDQQKIIIVIQRQLEQEQSK